MKVSKIISLLVACTLVLASVMSLVSCGTPAKTTAQKIADGDILKVGIIQYMSHPSLDNCATGIKAALEESGLKCDVDLRIGSSTAADSDCTSFAQSMTTSGYDIIIAIATPAAKSAFAATADTAIPVIFCAVNDPVSAKLVNSLEQPGEACTGTSDVLDLAGQLDMICALQPSVKSIGILYTSSEENSLYNLAQFRKLCEAKNIELVASAVQNAADIPAAAEAVASKADCINNFTDNNVVNNLTVLLEAANKYHIPVYGSEIEQVKNGCLASMSIDYVALGKVTGQMAVDVLKGADAATMPVRAVSDSTPVINTDVVKTLGFAIPASLNDAEHVTTNP